MTKTEKFILITKINPRFMLVTMTIDVENLMKNTKISIAILQKCSFRFFLSTENKMQRKKNMQCCLIADDQ